MKRIDFFEYLRRIWLSDKKILLSLIFSLVIFLFIQLRFQPYSLHLEKTAIGRKGAILFHDFDHDGNSEQFQFQFDYRTSAFTLTVYEKEMTERYSYTLKNWGLVRYLFKFADINHDGMDELYLFEMEEDKIYLLMYDYQRNEIIRKILIYTKKKAKTGKDYQIRVRFIHFADFDRDGELDAWILLNDFNDLHLSRVLVVSLKKNAVIREITDFGEFYSECTAVVRNERLIGYLFSPGMVIEEFRRQKGFRWAVTLLDSSMEKVLFKKYYHFPIEKALAVLLEGDQGLEILVSMNVAGGGAYHDRLELLSVHGTTLKAYEIEEGSLVISPYAYQVGRGKSRMIALIERKNHSVLLQFGDALNLIREKILDDQGYRYLEYFPLNRNRSSHVLISQDKILFLDEDFNTLTGGNIDAPYLFLNYSMLRKAGVPVLVINTLDYLYELGISPNYFYRYRFVVIFVFWGLIYSLIFSLNLLYREFMVSVILKRTAINKTFRGIMLMSQQGEILFMNRNMFQSFQLRKLEKHANYHQVFSHIPPIMQLMEEVIKNRTPISREIVSFQNNVFFSGLVVGIPLKKQLFMQHLFYFEVEDYSLPLQSDRLKLWTEAVSQMVHDIKTPLATVGINLQVIRFYLNEHKVEGLDEILEKFTVIENELQRIHQKTREFLRFTSLNAVQFEEVDLVKIIHKILKRLLPLYDGKVTFEFYPDTQPVFVRADRRMVEFLLDILIENGIQAMNGRGRIKIFYEINKETRRVWTSVQDEGKGISREELQKIFEPFYTTKEGGTGLGLVFAQKIVTDHGGELKVRTELGKGSTFSFSLPFIEKNL